MGHTFKDSRDKYDNGKGNRYHKDMKRFKKNATYTVIRCGATGKVGFYRFEDAEKKANEIMSSDPTAHLRIYKCEWCRNYHFTKKIN
jgi:hypothetical protein